MKSIIKLLSMTALVLCALAFSVWAGSFEASVSSGIMDSDGKTPLQGNVMMMSGDLVQLIHTGPDGEPNLPDSLGNPTGDDILLCSTFVGYGYPFNPNEGKFSIICTNDLLTLKATIFLRAWNNPAVLPGQVIHYGDSEVYTMANDFDSHDFVSFTLSQMINTPVELALFTASAQSGYIGLHWVTQSETNNLGFLIYRSETQGGEKILLTEKMIEGAMNSQIRHDYHFEDYTIQEKVVYYYYLADVALDGRININGPATAVAAAIPADYVLEQNFPNPFNPSTSIKYTLQESGIVKLAVYNIRGQLIKQLVNQSQDAGKYSVDWDGKDASGVVVPSGTYIYSLEVNDYKAVRRMTMTK